MTQSEKAPRARATRSLPASYTAVARPFAIALAAPILGPLGLDALVELGSKGFEGGKENREIVELSDRLLIRPQELRGLFVAANKRGVDLDTFAEVVTTLRAEQFRLAKGGAVRAAEAFEFVTF